MQLISIVSLLISLAALIQATLEKRASGQFPLMALLREWYAVRPWSGEYLALGCLAGSTALLGPLGVSSLYGWVEVERIGLQAAGIVLFVITLVVKLAWVAAEEIIFRGALLTQAARWTPPGAAVLVSAALFAFSHVDRDSPDFFALAVWFLDGVGFGVLFLASGRLWGSVIWHGVKNIWVWLLFSESTIQFRPGLWRLTYTGPDFWVGLPGQVGALDVAFTLGAVLLVGAALHFRRS